MEISIEYKPQVLNQLQKLPLSERNKILKKLRLLELQPFAVKYLKGEFEGLFALRAWLYRIMYGCNVKTGRITVLSVFHRHGVYK